MSDSTFSVVNNIDTSKSLTVDVSGNGSNVTTQLVTTGTTNRVLTLPDITDTLVTKNSVDILQNKTFISPSVSGVCTFESDIVIQGNIYQFGDTVILDNTVLSTGDNLIKLASNNTLTDITDTGVYSVYSNIGVTSYTGLFRDATDKIYKFFDECTIEPETTIGVSFAFADVRVNKLYTETVSSASNLVINDNVYITNNGKIGINVVPTSTLDVIGSANFNNTVGITTAGISINKTDPVANLDVLGSVRVENTNVNITLTGTASVSGTTVTGSGTVFTTEVLPGDSITINAETRIVSSITNDTELVVSASMTTVSGVGITLHRSPFQANDILINTSGYIGLGTKFPAFPLQIDSNSASWSQKITNNNSTIFLGNNSGEGLNINTGTLASSSYSVVCSGISGVLFKVQTDGKVAINSGTPSELLDVSTNIAGQGAQIGNAFLGVWLGSNAYTSFTHSALKANSTGYSIRQHSSGDTAVNAPTSKSIFFNIADTNKMIIDPSGNVGIGTGSPDATLNVDGTGHFTGNLTIDGNVYISGTSAELHTSSVVVDDSLIKLADNNTTDAVDIGIYGQYNNSGIKYSGMFRDHTDGVFKIFHQLSVSPGITSVPFAGTGYTDADLRVGNFTATGNSVISGGQRITPTIVTGNVTLNNDYNTVLVNGTVTVTLPQARSVDTFTGVVFTIINIGVGVVTIQVSASDTIDNQVTSHFLYSQYDRSAFYNIGSDISNSEIGVWLTM
jgi:hypothetical protein